MGNEFWDVFPKLVKVSTSPVEQSIPLSIRGEVESPSLESSNTEVATIGPNGEIRCGRVPGASVIMIWRSAARDSVRHVQVEVYGSAMQG
jgi:hypothetical protein